MQNQSNRKIAFDTQLKTALFGDCVSTLILAKKISRYFLYQSEVKPKPILIFLARKKFFRGKRRLHVFASSSDWFIGLPVSVRISQSNYFGFGFTTLRQKCCIDVTTHAVFIPARFCKVKTNAGSFRNLFSSRNQVHQYETRLASQ